MVAESWTGAATAILSEKTEKLIKIILPDLLNYLEMVESGEIIEKRVEKNITHKQKKEEVTSEN